MKELRGEIRPIVPYDCPYLGIHAETAKGVSASQRFEDRAGQRVGEVHFARSPVVEPDPKHATANVPGFLDMKKHSSLQRHNRIHWHVRLSLIPCSQQVRLMSPSPHLYH